MQEKKIGEGACIGGGGGAYNQMYYFGGYIRGGAYKWRGL